MKGPFFSSQGSSKLRYRGTPRSITYSRSSTASSESAQLIRDKLDRPEGPIESAVYIASCERSVSTTEKIGRLTNLTPPRFIEESTHTLDSLVLRHDPRIIDSRGDVLDFNFVASHVVQPKGLVWNAAACGDHKKLFSALAGGCSTEEISAVRYERNPGVVQTRTHSDRLLL